MNCRDTENLLFAERDGALTESQRADLARHLAECAGCRQLRDDLAAAATAWRAHTAAVKVPDAGAEWRKVRARLHGEEVRTPAKRRLAPIIWLGAPAAAAAAVALAFFVRSSGPDVPALASAAARVEYVEVSDATSSPMVYVDKESGWLFVVAAETSGKTSG